MVLTIDFGMLKLKSCTIFAKITKFEKNYLVVIYVKAK